MTYPHNTSALDLFLRRLLSHSPLSDAEQHVILALPTKRVEVRAHEDVVRLGETVDHACLVEEGLMGRFGLTATGARQFVSVHFAGEMADLPSLMVPTAQCALNAVTRSAVLRVPHQALREAGGRHPAIAAAFWRDCVINAGIADQWLVNLGRRDSRARLAHLLCEMCYRYGQLGDAPARRFIFPMTQEQLADALGLTSVHVNRTLMALRDDGLATIARGLVEILDWDGLAAAAEFDSGYLHLPVG
jgi:CRP-like cAMP-binding protein